MVTNSTIGLLQAGEACARAMTRGSPALLPSRDWFPLGLVVPSLTKQPLKSGGSLSYPILQDRNKTSAN